MQWRYKKWSGLILIILLSVCLGNTGFNFKSITGNWVVVEAHMNYNARVFVLKSDATFSTLTSDFQTVETKGRYYVDFSKSPAWIDFEPNNSQYRTEGYLQVIDHYKMILYMNTFIPLEPVYAGSQTIIPKRPTSLDRSVYTLTLRRLK